VKAKGVHLFQCNAKQRAMPRPGKLEFLQRAWALSTHPVHHSLGNCGVNRVHMNTHAIVSTPHGPHAPPMAREAGRRRI